MNREHWQRFVRGIATHAITKGQSIEECAARADEILAALSSARKTALEEACKAVCWQCELGVGLDGEYHVEPGVKATWKNSGQCQALKLRRLSKGDK